MANGCKLLHPEPHSKVKVDGQYRFSAFGRAAFKWLPLTGTFEGSAGTSSSVIVLNQGFHGDRWLMYIKLDGPPKNGETFTFAVNSGRYTVCYLANIEVAGPPFADIIYPDPNSDNCADYFVTYGTLGNNDTTIVSAQMKMGANTPVDADSIYEDGNGFWAATFPALALGTYQLEVTADGSATPTPLSGLNLVSC